MLNENEKLSFSERLRYFAFVSNVVVRASSLLVTGAMLANWLSTIADLIVQIRSIQRANLSLINGLKLQVRHELPWILSLNFNHYMDFAFEKKFEHWLETIISLNAGKNSIFNVTQERRAETAQQQSFPAPQVSSNNDNEEQLSC